MYASAVYVCKLLEYPSLEYEKPAQFQADLKFDSRHQILLSYVKFWCVALNFDVHNQNIDV